MRGGRGEVDDDAVPALAHRHDEGLADDDRADEVVVDQRLHVLDRDIERVVRQRLAALRADVAAGAIHQHVDRPELCLDVRPHLRDRGRIADVAGDGGGADAVFLDRLRHLAEIFGLAVFRRRGPVEVVDRDVGAELRQPLGHDAAEPAARPGHECDRPAQFLGHRKISVHMMPSARMFAALRRIIAIS